MQRGAGKAAWIAVAWAGAAAALQAQGTAAPGAVSHPVLRPSQREKSRPAPIVRAPALTPLTPRERVVQLLDRFTYGPRPGEVDRLLATGAAPWFEGQLNPAGIPDSALARRLAELPTLTMTPAQALAVFPDRQQVQAVAQGKAAMPTDPLERGVFEVQVAKWQAEQDRKKADGSAQPAAELTEAEKAAQKKADGATAARIAGELFALPKEHRMAALLALPVPDRIAFTANGNLQGQQRNLLLADFTPRERETFSAMGGQVSSSGNLANELAQGHMLRDILSERQLETVMTDFWFNHFNVFIGKDSDQWYTASYERDAIRAHALGHFHDLLLATAVSPAMMVYLDNWLSIGPDSLANGVNPANPKSHRGNKGLNENYGREVMELHTVGVNGGYSQADVTTLSAILTGWGVDKPGEGGPFLFDPKRHEPGPKVWFGHQIADGGQITSLPASTEPPATTFGPSAVPATAGSVTQGVMALSTLAASPQCARYISTKLAQYFVADAPPPALVDRLTKAYLASDGDIRVLLRTIVESPEFNSRQYFRTKVKTPAEFLASAFRATGTDPQNLGSLVNEAKTMGMPLYYALPPTGYYLTADHWMNSTALVDRLNFAYQLTGGTLPNQRFDAPRLLAAGMLASQITAQSTALHPQPAGTEASSPEAATLHSVSIRNGKSSAAESVTASNGPLLATELLENTILSGPVSAKTHALIVDQIARQPVNASATDKLNLASGLLLGSPEFQLR